MMDSKHFSRRSFLITISQSAAAISIASSIRCGDGANSRSPNIIVIFCDDMGYGDLGCFGSKKHQTPCLDKMAQEGMRFTSFYVTSGVCTPSRSSLLTGCYPRRVGMHQNSMEECVLFPVAKKGLNPNEITIAEILKDQGYNTACIGKWHLGDQPEFLPTRQGFDHYYGIPYSNDMGAHQRPPNPNLPLLENETVIEAPVQQETITQQYTSKTIDFIKKNQNNPFFIYLPHTMVHNPLHASIAFRGTSANGRYGDAVEEIDWSTGKILQTLKDLGLDEKTLVIFTSDNGAASRFGGSNLPLSGWKGSTMEGGMREPCIMRWPGKIPAGKICDELVSTLDLLPTIARLAGTTEPQDRVIDGKNIYPLMTGKDVKSPHNAFYYYQMDQLQAVRSGKYKLHLPLENKKRNWGKPLGKTPAKLYDLSKDIGETTDIAAEHPEIMDRLMALADKARKDIGDEDQKGQNQRTAGFVVTPKPLVMFDN